MLWSVDSGDSAGADADTIAATVVEAAGAGDIVLLQIATAGRCGPCRRSSRACVASNFVWCRSRSCSKTELS
ncbi:MAG: hypothetical protein U0168_30775 [Nannocystaceae bacterium]